jgi:hypothetical protein
VLSHDKFNQGGSGIKNRSRTGRRGDSRRGGRAEPPQAEHSEKIRKSRKSRFYAKKHRSKLRFKANEILSLYVSLLIFILKADFFKRETFQQECKKNVCEIL